jgi:hypothetical protein
MTRSSILSGTCFADISAANQGHGVHRMDKKNEKSGQQGNKQNQTGKQGGQKENQGGGQGGQQGGKQQAGQKR